jgi:hypothetical protein
MRALKLVPAAVLFLTSVSASAAVRLTYERKKAGAAGAEPGSATITVDGEHIRMDGMTAGQRAGRSSAMIVDAGAKKMLMLDADRKVYREITEADAKQMKERMDGARAQMAARMKDIPPEHRKQAEEMMARMGGGGEASEVKYEPLGTKKKIAGFACEVYRVQVGTHANNESCFAPWSSNIITKAEAAQFKKLFESLQKSFAFVPSVRAADWSKAPGIPIEQTHFAADGKTAEWTNTLKSVTRPSVAASEFQVPSGYTKEEMPMGRGGPGGPRGPGGRPGGPGGPHGPEHE